MRVVDVAAETVGAPGCRQELHRPLRAGRARGAKLAERGLDEVHRGQDLPGDGETALRLAVVAQQPIRRLGLPGAERRERQPRRRREPHEGSPRGEHVAGVSGEARREAARPPRRRTPAARGQAPDTAAAGGAPRAAARAAAARSRPRASRRRPRGARSSSSRGPERSRPHRSGAVSPAEGPPWAAVSAAAATSAITAARAGRR